MTKKLSIFVLLARKGMEPAGIYRVAESLITEFSSVNDVLIKSISFDDFKFVRKFPGKLQKIINFITYCFYIPQLVRKNGINVFLATNNRLPPFLPKNCLKAIIVHDLVFKKYPQTMKRLNYIVDKLCLPYALKKADVLLAISESTANDIREFYPQHSHKIRRISLAGYVSTPKISAKITRDYVLFVGTIEPRKNLKRLMMAFASLPMQMRKNFQLVICGGSGWGNVAVTELIKQHDLESHVIVTGYVTDAELELLYKNAYCLALPSLYEGFGLPILEAHSFGVPVLTSNTSSMPEVAGSAAVFVDPFDVTSIANGLASLLVDSAFRNSLSELALQNSKKFSWKITTQQILQILKSENHRAVAYD